MAYRKLDFRGQAFKDVLGFTFRHWAQQPWRIVAIAALALFTAGADILTPVFAGRLVDAIASGPASPCSDSPRRCCARACTSTSSASR
jgi:ATP-binding cassette, subfamily B, bacterial